MGIVRERFRDRLLVRIRGQLDDVNLEAVQLAERLAAMGLEVAGERVVRQTRVGGHEDPALHPLAPRRMFDRSRGWRGWIPARCMRNVCTGQARDERRRDDETEKTEESRCEYLGFHAAPFS